MALHRTWFVHCHLWEETTSHAHSIQSVYILHCTSLCPQRLLLCLLPDPPLRTPPTRLTLLKVGVLVMELRDGYQLSLGLH